MLRVAFALIFVCLAGAPTLAHAQALDCASPSGLTQRVCAAPELVALEEERGLLLSELQVYDPAHAMLMGEDAWLAEQSACADDACLSAAYLNHNQSLRLAVQAARSDAPDASAPMDAQPDAQPPPETREGPERGGPAIIGPTVNFGEYIGAIVAVIVTLLIALWLLGVAARARRADREEN